MRASGADVDLKGGGFFVLVCVEDAYVGVRGEEVDERGDDVELVEQL